MKRGGREAPRGGLAGSGPGLSGGPSLRDRASRTQRAVSTAGPALTGHLDAAGSRIAHTCEQARGAAGGGRSSAAGKGPAQPRVVGEPACGLGAVTPRTCATLRKTGQEGRQEGVTRSREVRGRRYAGWEHEPCPVLGSGVYLRAEVTSKGARCLSPTAAAWGGGPGRRAPPRPAPPRRGPLGQVVAPQSPARRARTGVEAQTLPWEPGESRRWVLLGTFLPGYPPRSCSVTARGGSGASPGLRKGPLSPHPQNAPYF